MKRYLAKLSIFVALSLVIQSQAHAEVVPCTSIPGLNVSHFVTHNNEYGGHVNAHVRGQTPPTGFTQNGRTLFRDYQDWEDAYNALANQEPALMCNTNANIGTEAARTLPRQYFSYQCTAANVNGVCTHGNEIQTNHVIFVMRVVPNGNSQRWIVYTAYPTPQ